MDRERLAWLNEAVQSEHGKRLVAYMQDVMIETASFQNASAEWVKGMGILINRIKRIEQDFKKELEKGRN